MLRYPLLNSLSLCFYFTIASSRFLYTCNLTNRKRPEDFLVQKESSLVCSSFGNYALSGASFISTGIHITLVVAIVTLCQWPEWGDLHFYLSQTVQKYNSVFWCQCLNGATSISTQRRPGKGLVESQSCQCPEWGDLHFYRHHRWQVYIIFGVSMP